jgi:hypothetical protein
LHADSSMMAKFLQRLNQTVLQGLVVFNHHDVQRGMQSTNLTWVGLGS